MSRRASSSGTHTSGPHPLMASTNFAARPGFVTMQQVYTPVQLADIAHGFAGPRLRNQLAAEIRPSPQPNRNLQNRANQFKVPTPVKIPERILICAKRRLRREIMFALKLRGKGAGARRRRNHTSRVSC